MKVRSLQINFETLDPHWSRYLDFAQSMNATSTVPTAVEPYLAKVLARARKTLAGSAPELTEEISLFVRQEMEHCRQHVACNQMLLRAYPEIEPLLERYEADYDRFLRERPLQFNVAYAEGFESMIGLTTPIAWKARDALWAESDPRVETLWKWHLAEEHEHREVMFKVYRALFGNGPKAYFYRVYGLLFAMVHIGGHIRRLRTTLLEIDRRRMGEEAWRNRVPTPRQPKGGLQFLRRFAHVLSPFYDPARREPLPGLEPILEQSSVHATSRATTRAAT